MSIQTPGEDVWGKPCCVCKQVDVNPQVLCDECNTAYHLQCLKLPVLPNGPWFCAKCRRNHLREGIWDITQDANLMYYIFNKAFPEGISDDEKMRITTAGRHYTTKDDKLFLRQGSRVREIPAICERELIIKQAHETLGHCMYRRLESVLNKRYYWVRMREQLIQFCKQCKGCASEYVKFKVPKELQPTEKPSRPF